MHTLSLATGFIRLKFYVFFFINDVTENKWLDWIMIEWGDTIFNWNEVFQLFKAKYTDQEISSFILFRFVYKSQKAGNFRDLSRPGRSKTLTKIDRENILLTVTEHPHAAVRPIA